MPLISSFPVDSGEVPPAPLRPKRTRGGRARDEVLITGGCVVGGLALALTALPPLPTPAAAAQGFIEAAYSEDWPTAWELLCHSSRDRHGDLDSFADTASESVARADAPPDLTVETEGMRAVTGTTSPTFTVSIAVSSDSASRTDCGELTVIREDGDFRICHY